MLEAWTLGFLPALAPESRALTSGFGYGKEKGRRL